jgi:hypothetical protein
MLPAPVHKGEIPLVMSNNVTQFPGKPSPHTWSEQFTFVFFRQPAHKPSPHTWSERIAVTAHMIISKPSPHTWSEPHSKYVKDGRYITASRCWSYGQVTANFLLHSVAIATTPQTIPRASRVVFLQISRRIIIASYLFSA